MGRDRDSNHLVSGGDVEGDADFTQPSAAGWSNKLGRYQNISQGRPLEPSL